MQDLLYVSFDKDEKKNEIGLCVGRQNADQSHTILKMVLDDKAENIYKILTEQKVDARPVVRARWVDDHCSNCGCDVPAYIIDWKWQKDMDAKFCPQCGAEMR